MDCKRQRRGEPDYNMKRLLFILSIILVGYDNAGTITVVSGVTTDCTFKETA